MKNIAIALKHYRANRRSGKKPPPSHRRFTRYYSSAGAPKEAFGFEVDGIEEDTQWTAGLGLNIVGVRVDLGALFSSADTGAALELGTSF